MNNKKQTLRNTEGVIRGNSFRMDPRTIIVDEDTNFRTGIEAYGTEERQAEMRENVKNNGIQEAVRIVSRNGEWHLVHGFRRMRAFRQLNELGQADEIESIPVLQVEDNAESIMLDHLNLNTGLEFSIVDKAELLLKYTKLIGKENYTELAKKVNMDVQKVRKLIIFAKQASTQIKDKIVNRNMALSTAEKIVNKYSNIEEQNDVLARASETANGGFIRIKHIPAIKREDNLNNPIERAKDILRDIITSVEPDENFKRTEAKLCLEFLNAVKSAKTSDEDLIELFRTKKESE